MEAEIGRNDPCHCGSGKKYKKCHLEKDETKDRKVREKAALNSAKVAATQAENSSSDDKNIKQHPHSEKKGWLNRMAGKVGFLKTLTQRRTPQSRKGG